MKIKNILIAALMCCGFTTAFTSCSNDEEAFFTATADDSPRFLNVDFPEDYKGGNPSVIKTLNRNENFTFKVLVTPVDYTTVTWLIDDAQVAEGSSIDYQMKEAGEHILKIVATTTKGLTTSRTFIIIVNPLSTDPKSSSTALEERLLKVGASVKLYGENMANVVKVSINGQQADVTNATEGSVEYTVPTGLADGTYTIYLIDNTGASFAAGDVTVITKATVHNTLFAGSSKASFTMEGSFLNKVATLTINGQDCVITEKTESKLIATAPELAAGDYELKGTTESGEMLHFYKDGKLVDNALFMVSEEEILWMGDFVVDWDGPEDHKEWRMISQEKFANFEIGHTLTISLKLVGNDYHKYQFDNWSWSPLPGQSPTDFGEDLDVTVEITQALKDAVAEQAFCIHGHGFSVIKATYK